MHCGRAATSEEADHVGSIETARREHHHRRQRGGDVVDVRGDKVKLGIEAPQDVSVHRREVYEAIRRENQQAAKLRPEDARGLGRPPLDRPPQLSGVAAWRSVPATRPACDERWRSSATSPSCPARPAIGATNSLAIVLSPPKARRFLPVDISP